MSHNRYSSAAASLLKLAAPVIASQTGGMMVTIADTVMVAKLGNVELASVAFSSNLTVPVMFFGIGVATCATPLIGRRYGQGRIESIAHTISHARTMNIGVAILQLIVLSILWVLLPYMGQPSEVVEIAKTYLPILTISMLGQQMFMSAKTIIEGLQNTVTPMRISLAANMLNIAGNYVLIFGFGPMQGLGVYGAAVSTLVARTAMWIGVEIALRSKLKEMNVIPEKWARRNIAKRMFLIGLPIGTQSVVECLGFTCGAIMMGWLGTNALSAHQIVMTFTSLTYLMASGIGTAATIKVSLFCGNNDAYNVNRFAKTALALAAIFMSCTAISFIITRNWLPSLIADDADTISIASRLMIVGALFQLFDGLQVTALGALRGLGDLRYPALVACISYAATCIPVAYINGFTINLQGPGVWSGYVVGLGIASTMLLLRLRKQLNKS